MSDNSASAFLLLADEPCNDAKATRWHIGFGHILRVAPFLLASCVACGVLLWSSGGMGEAYALEADATDIIDGYLAIPNPSIRGITSCLGVDVTHKVSLSSCSPWNRWTYSVVTKNIKYLGTWCLTIKDGIFTGQPCNSTSSQQFDFGCHIGERYCKGTISSVKYGGCVELGKANAWEYIPRLRSCSDTSTTQVFTMRDILDTPHNAHVVAVAEGTRGSDSPAVLEITEYSAPDGSYTSTSSQMRLMLRPDGSARLVVASHTENSYVQADEYDVLFFYGDADVEAGVIKNRWTECIRCTKGACHPAPAVLSGYETFNLWTVLPWTVVPDSKTAASDTILGMELSTGFDGLRRLFPSVEDAVGSHHDV